MDTKIKPRLNFSLFFLSIFIAVLPGQFILFLFILIVRLPSIAKANSVIVDSIGLTAILTAFLTSFFTFKKAYRFLKKFFETAGNPTNHMGGEK